MTVPLRIASNATLGRKSRGKRRPAQPLRTDRRAGMVTLLAVALPVMATLGALSANSARMFLESQLINQVAQNAALAGGAKLTTYYTSSNGSTAAIVAAAQLIGAANAPAYPNVVPASNVVIGNWDLTTRTFSSLSVSHGTTPNAVQVTGSATFDRIFGLGRDTITKTAVASVGSPKIFNVIVLNDMSSSFGNEITQQRAADQAILNCIAQSADSRSQFGITAFTGHAFTYVPLTKAQANLATLTTSISGLLACTTNGSANSNNPPKCAGSNAAAGFYSAIAQFAAAGCANCNNNIVVITDGVPNASTSLSGGYIKADGTYVNSSGTGSSTTALCSGTNCTDAKLLTMAKGQAAIAGAAGVAVSTIYYTGNTTGSSTIAQYEAELLGWTKNGGIAMNIPTTAAISATSGGICSLMGFSLKQVQM